MKTPLKSLTIVLGTTLSVLASSQAASAVLFNWSYTTAGSDVYTGMMEGVQVDQNTVNVTSVFMSQLNGIDLAPTPIVLDIYAAQNTTGIVSFDGSFMSLSACRDTSCYYGLQGGIFMGDFFTTISESNITIDAEDFAPARWTLTEVPEPSSTLALVGLGLSALAQSCLKKN